MGRKKAPPGGRHLPAEDLLRLLHSQNLGKIRTVIKSGLDPNGIIENTSCFDNTTWVLKDRKPVVPMLIFACFNGVSASVLDLLIKLGASPNAVTDCGLPAPLAVLCAKVSIEEQRALFQVLRQHRCATFNSLVRSARNEDPIHVTSKLLDLSDWTAARKVEGVDMLIQFGTFQLSGPEGALDEQALYEFVAMAVRYPCGHKLLDCMWRHFPAQLLPTQPVDGCLLLRALGDSWLDPAWRHSEERQHTMTMGVVLRTLLEHPALQQQHREAVAIWLRANMAVLLYRPELVASLLDRAKPQPDPADPGQATPTSRVLCFSPDDCDLVLPVGLLAGPAALHGEVPLAGGMSLMLAYTVDTDEQLARQGVEMLLSRGARVDLPCPLGPEVLGEGTEDITPLLAVFLPYQRNAALVELLWKHYADTCPALATAEVAARLRTAAHSLFLHLPGWRGALERATQAAAAAAAAAANVGAEGGEPGAECGASAVSAAAAAAAAAAGGLLPSLLLDANASLASRERLRDLLDSNVLEFVDGRNLEQVETVLLEMLGGTHSESQQDGQPAAGAPAATAAAVLPAFARLSLAEQLALVSERLEREQAHLDELYVTGRSDAEVDEDPEVWSAEARIEALAAVKRCLLRAQSAGEAGATASSSSSGPAPSGSAAAAAAATGSAPYELHPGVAFVEVVASRIMSQPEWGFSRGLLLQLAMCQMRRMLRGARVEGDEEAAASLAGQMEVLRLHYEELLGGMAPAERQLLGNLVRALEKVDEARAREEEQEERGSTVQEEEGVQKEEREAAAAAAAVPAEGPDASKEEEAQQPAGEGGQQGNGQEGQVRDHQADKRAGLQSVQAAEAGPQSPLGSHAGGEAEGQAAAALGQGAPHAGSDEAGSQLLSQIALADLHRAMLPGEGLDDDWRAGGGEGGDIDEDEEEGEGNTTSPPSLERTRRLVPAGYEAAEVLAMPAAQSAQSVKPPPAGVHSPSTEQSDYSQQTKQQLPQQQVEPHHQRRSAHHSPCTRLHGGGPVGGGPSWRHRRREFGSESGMACLDEAAPLGMGPAELDEPGPLLGGAGTMSVPQHVRHGHGMADSCSSDGSVRELGSYEYLGAAVMLHNGSADDEGGGGGRAANNSDPAAGMYGSDASSAYDTPTEGGSGDETAGMLAAQVRALQGGGGAGGGGGGGGHRRLSNASSTSSGVSYGSALGGYGAGVGYGPEYGLESIGGDTGALGSSLRGLAATTGAGAGPMAGSSRLGRRQQRQLLRGQVLAGPHPKAQPQIVPDLQLQVVSRRRRELQCGSGNSSTSGSLTGCSPIAAAARAAARERRRGIAAAAAAAAAASARRKSGGGSQDEDHAVEETMQYLQERVRADGGCRRGEREARLRGGPRDHTGQEAHEEEADEALGECAPRQQWRPHTSGGSARSRRSGSGGSGGARTRSAPRRDSTDGSSASMNFVSRQPLTRPATAPMTAAAATFCAAAGVVTATAAFAGRQVEQVAPSSSSAAECRAPGAPGQEVVTAAGGSCSGGGGVPLVGVVTASAPVSRSSSSRGSSLDSTRAYIVHNARRGRCWAGAWPARMSDQGALDPRDPSGGDGGEEGHTNDGDDEDAANARDGEAEGGGSVKSGDEGSTGCQWCAEAAPAGGGRDGHISGAAHNRPAAAAAPGVFPQRRRLLARRSHPTTDMEAAARNVRAPAVPADAAAVQPSAGHAGGDDSSGSDSLRHRHGWHSSGSDELSYGSEGSVDTKRPDRTGSCLGGLQIHSGQDERRIRTTYGTDDDEDTADSAAALRGHAAAGNGCGQGSRRQRGPGQGHRAGGRNGSSDDESSVSSVNDGGGGPAAARACSAATGAARDTPSDQDDDVSSTSTQEWPPRRPAERRTGAPTTSGSPGIATGAPAAAAAAAAGADVDDVWVRAGRRADADAWGSEHSDPFSVGFSGRRPEYGSVPDLELEPRPEASDGSDATGAAVAVAAAAVRRSRLSSSASDSSGPPSRASGPPSSPSSPSSSDRERAAGGGGAGTKKAPAQRRSGKLRTGGGEDGGEDDFDIGGGGGSSSDGSVTSKPPPGARFATSGPGVAGAAVGPAVGPAVGSRRPASATTAAEGVIRPSGDGGVGAVSSPPQCLTSGEGSDSGDSGGHVSDSSQEHNAAGGDDGGGEDDDGPGVSGRPASPPSCAPLQLQSRSQPEAGPGPGFSAAQRLHHQQPQEGDECGQQVNQQSEGQEATDDLDELVDEQYDGMDEYDVSAPASMRPPGFPSAAMSHSPPVASPGAGPGESPYGSQPPCSSDKALSSLLAVLANTANIHPRTSWVSPGSAAALGQGQVQGQVQEQGQGQGSATVSAGGSAAAAAAATAQQSYVLHLSGAAPGDGFSPPPAAVARVLAALPSRPEGLHSWVADLQTALATASGCEHQRVFLVADAPARTWPAWLPGLRAAVAGAVFGPLRAAGQQQQQQGGGQGGGRGRARRQCPEWLRQTVALLPLCHLVFPFGGIYLYQAATRACQETLDSLPASPPAARPRPPLLHLDPDCLAAAVAFMEAHPGNMYGRALLMQFAERQVMRALFRSPRYGLMGAARSAESLQELLFAGGDAAGYHALCGPTGHPAAEAGPGAGLVEEDEGEEGQTLRGTGLTYQVVGTALSAARQMQALWRATWPGGHAIRLASYSYLTATAYPRAVVAALNSCVPLVLDGVADLSELLAEMRALAYGTNTALAMAEEILASHPPGGSEEDEEMAAGTDTLLAFKHLVSALKAAIEPGPRPGAPSTAPPPGPGGPPPAPLLGPWSQLREAQREQLVDEMLTIADLLMIVHAVLLALRTALSYAADGGAAVATVSAAALRREVAEVQMMRVAASRMLVQRMETQERSPEKGRGWGRDLGYGYRYGYDTAHRPYEGGEQHGHGGSRGVAGTAAAEGGQLQREPQHGEESGRRAAAAVGERVSWRHVNGLYEHGKTVLQYAADAGAAMVDPQIRAEEADRCELLVAALLSDAQLLDCLHSLAAMPPHHQLELRREPPGGAAGGADPAGPSPYSAPKCNEVLYRMMVVPWREDPPTAQPSAGEEGRPEGETASASDPAAPPVPSLESEFERSSWSMPTLLRGDFRPVGQSRMRRLFDEVRALAGECLDFLTRIAPLEEEGEGEGLGLGEGEEGPELGSGGDEGQSRGESEEDTGEGGGLDDPL